VASPIKAQVTLPINGENPWETDLSVSSTANGSTASLLLVNSAPSGKPQCDTAGIMLTGIIKPGAQAATGVTVTYPVRIDWSLYGIYGSRVDDDADPIFQGSTFLTSASDTREGLLVQVAGRLGTAWYLRARVVDTPAALPYTLFKVNLNLGARMLSPGLALGGLDVQVGPLIG
jgi:hypothetical protein